VLIHRDVHIPGLGRKNWPCAAATRSRAPLIAALGFTICLQAFVNIGTTIGAIPLTGITLPFFSDGGTSLVVSLIALGFMYALARQ